MKYIKSYLFLTLALLLIPIAAFAQNSADLAPQHLPVWIEETKIDGSTVYPYEWNKLNIERNNEFELKLYLTATADAENIEIDASFSGYEYDKISAHISSFDVEQDTMYVKKMKIMLPEDMDVDEYNLRVIVSDRNNYEQVYNYNLKIDAPRHELKLKDVMLNPNKDILAGAGFVTKIRLENVGQKDEKDIKVTIGLPELGVQTSEYVDKLESGDEKDTEEIFIRLPKCTEAGEYVVAIEALYNNQHDKLAAFTKLTVLENPNCKKAEEKQQVQVIVQQEPEQGNTATQVTQPTETTKTTSNKSMRTVLEVALIVLVALLIIVGFAIGFSKWRQDE